ncbi:alpha/beta fold hydrolase [Dyella sp. Tek66A03]|uniref:alpha/beta fold hydrolase n=1 Tax=Dyella sp. Tek66A03 TaxID=3458298 RepID=UPI00403EE1F6
MPRMGQRPPVIFIHGFIGALVPDFPFPHASPDMYGYGKHRNAPVDVITLPHQVDYLRTFVDEHFHGGPVDLVGHSVGGAIAMLFAHAYPDHVRRIVNIEGNFTLADAFWSASVGRMSQSEAEALLDGFRADPAAWIGRSVITPKPESEAVAAQWLDFQPASTLRAMGQSVVSVTGDGSYLEALAKVFEERPVYLLSGERSHDGWHVPDWALQKCAGRLTLAGCGHLMMLDNPPAFSAALASFLTG